jgi:hypothetical protein
MAEEGKLSDLEGEEREQALAYVNRRWAQYSSATRDTRKDAAKLIAAVNAGGAAAVLAFMGAVMKEGSPVAKALPLKLLISSFVLGVLLCAFAHAVEHARLSGLFVRWRSDVDKLYADALAFDKMQQDDVDRSGENESVAIFFIWTALVCFGIGAGLGIFLLFEGG